MKFWQAALLSLMLVMCIGGLLRVYAPWTGPGVSFGIGFVITAGAFLLVRRDK
jgi:hypothetical protein